MNKEELDNIQELIERKITLAEVTGGLTSSDKKFIALWNYTIELQNQVEKLNQENNDLENLYILARDNLSKSLLENADLKERLNCDLKWALKYDELFFKNKNLQSAIEELEKWLKEMLDSEKDIFSVIRVKDVLDKLNELRSKK